MNVTIMDAKQIGRIIRERRKLLRVSQAQLADLAACSIPSIINAEAGKPTQQLDKLLAILKILGLSITISDSVKP